MVKIQGGSFEVDGEVIFHKHCGGDRGIVKLKTDNDGHSFYHCLNCGMSSDISDLISDFRRRACYKEEEF